MAHNGVCLTVTKVEGEEYEVTAVEETLARTNLGELQQGDLVNLERCICASRPSRRSHRARACGYVR